MDLSHIQKVWLCIECSKGSLEGVLIESDRCFDVVGIDGVAGSVVDINDRAKHREVARCPGVFRHGSSIRSGTDRLPVPWQSHTDSNVCTIAGWRDCAAPAAAGKKNDQVIAPTATGSDRTRCWWGHAL